MADRPRRFDVGILGAGAVGCAAAYYLARRRVSVVVVDRGGAGGGASAATSARVWIHTEEPAEYARLLLHSAHRYPVLQEQVGAMEYLRTGGLGPVFTVDEEARARDLVVRQGAAGLPVRWLSREEALRREPALNPQVIGATYCPADGSVNPFLLVRRLATAARRLGASFVLHSGYVAIRSRGGSFLLLTGRGEVMVRRLVVAAGAGTPDVLAHVDAALPLRAVFTHFAVTEKVPALLRHTLRTVRQQPSGEVLVEAPQEGPPVQCEAAPDVLLGLAREATRTIPSLGSARMLRAFTGVRAVPVDGLPILGPVDEDVYVAVAPRGITLCPLLGEAVAELVTRGRVLPSLEPWTPNRFEGVAAQNGKGGRQDSAEGL